MLFQIRKIDNKYYPKPLLIKSNYTIHSFTIGWIIDEFDHSHFTDDVAMVLDHPIFDKDEFIG